jgi:Tfp pilus assembly protein PilF
MKVLDVVLQAANPPVRLAALCLAAALLAAACGGSRRPAAPVVTPTNAATAGALYDSGVEQLARKEYAAAAQTLERCIEMDPTRAYAYYHVALAYQEMQRIDLMVARLETFVRLAPDAPERPAVEAMLRTVRK